MDLDSFRNYCLAKKGVTEELPFDDTTLVFKVMGKMFALCNLEQFEGASLKCDPERAIQLREAYEEIKGGYHLNKKHWNSIKANGRVGDQLFMELIDHSYDLVVSKLTKKDKELLQGM
ncbi:MULTISPECIES: MmcQ/YjbR family DNA-binding protein [Persicobacter]|uniref:MmcQ-like protein n=1 Tax=Persicobacter diffluens TaxID=981 RepID=A0AAN4VW68_9BACT|nr:MmcQ/YjbR family DNA-binding protein [Persicobacter sp. CCB-QB2]GJM60166.1 hypothetical protein PEDI_07180 [Persicobacter diffluens]